MTCALKLANEPVDLQDINYSVDYDANARRVRSRLSLILHRPVRYGGSVLGANGLHVGAIIPVEFSGPSCFIYPSGQYIIRSVGYTRYMGYVEVQLELELWEV